MGQVYSISTKWIYKDEQAVVDKITEYVKETEHYVNYGFDRGKDPVKDINGAMRLFFTDSVEEDPLRDGVYIADFDASYGWEEVMTNMFRHIAHVLQEGSYLSVFPDEDEVTLEVVDDGIKVTTVSMEF